MIKLEPENAYKSNETNYKQINEPIYGCHDSLRNGLRNIAQELTSSHPLDSVIGSNGKQLELNNRLYAIKCGFGTGAEERLKREFRMASSIQRFAGIPSSMSAFEVINGNDCEIDFGDYLAERRPFSMQN